MKRIILVMAITLIGTNVNAQNTDSLYQETTLFFVCHAETLDDGTSDPPLNVKGRKQVDRLANLLINEHHLSAIYSTSYKRTLETATIISERLGIPVFEYNLSEPNQFVERLIEDYKGEEVLVVGHSNTTPMLVNITLSTGLFEALDEDTYNQIFVVQANSVGRACVDVITY